jgi:hypothetical protein
MLSKLASEISFISCLSQLHTLILDDNRISTHTPFPRVDTLRTLSMQVRALPFAFLIMQNNLISDSERFCDQMIQCFPNLRELDLRGNAACPTASHINYNYRVFVVSKLPQLEHLDGRLITNEERYHSGAVKSTRE